MYFFILFILFYFVFFFFFQAEDGIRDWSVTGVQTCALPILFMSDQFTFTVTNQTEQTITELWVSVDDEEWASFTLNRSEERRVGKECRSRWWPEHLKKK